LHIPENRTFQVILLNIYSNAKTTHYDQRKIQINVSPEHIHKDPQQHINKSNPAVYKNKNTL
jgi:hypothetical protein